MSSKRSIGQEVIRGPSKTKRKKKKTSVGSSRNSKPKNKHSRRIHGKYKYRGQGK